MSYRAGIFGAPPSVSCDSPGCEVRIEINGLPPTWLLKRKAPRGWATRIIEDFRRDWCPPHKWQAPTASAKRGRP